MMKPESKGCAPLGKDTSDFFMALAGSHVIVWGCVPESFHSTVEPRLIVTELGANLNWSVICTTTVVVAAGAGATGATGAGTVVAVGWATTDGAVVGVATTAGWAAVTAVAVGTTFAL